MSIGDNADFHFWSLLDLHECLVGLAHSIDSAIRHESVPNRPCGIRTWAGRCRPYCRAPVGPLQQSCDCKGLLLAKESTETSERVGFATDISRLQLSPASLAAGTSL